MDRGKYIGWKVAGVGIPVGEWLFFYETTPWVVQGGWWSIGIYFFTAPWILALLVYVFQEIVWRDFLKRYRLLLSLGMCLLGIAEGWLPWRLNAVCSPAGYVAAVLVSLNAAGVIAGVSFDYICRCRRC